ncbi:MAG: phosphatidate cytidylyltransferase [Pseudobdellovibrio sp.]|jgi:phosphatidate cytidylyltransferase|nr:phosphatidate cytidylyltransferase [Pseudobdellovibrio sp.]
MKNLSYRAISAVVALVILVAALYYGQINGIYALVLFVVIRGSFEVARMFFAVDYPRFVKRLFVSMSTAVFILITLPQLSHFSNVAMIFSFVLVASFGVLFHKSFKDLDQILTFVAKNTLGLIYTCFLPATVVWMTRSPYGMQWFLCLLAVVFAGDIGAYIFGLNFGKHKIAPALSPKKSLEGAIGGLFFSAMASMVFINFIPTVPIYVFGFLGILGGMFGQIGDFFESLIKRVSGVKDSGSIMPGHGGVLDRLDGVLLSAPIFYFFASMFAG